MKHDEKWPRVGGSDEKFWKLHNYARASVWLKCNNCEYFSHFFSPLREQLRRPMWGWDGALECVTRRRTFILPLLRLFLSLNVNRIILSSHDWLGSALFVIIVIWPVVVCSVKFTLNRETVVRSPNMSRRSSLPRVCFNFLRRVATLDVHFDGRVQESKNWTDCRSALCHQCCCCCCCSPCDCHCRCWLKK